MKPQVQRVMMIRTQLFHALEIGILTSQHKNCSTSSALERTTLLNSCKKDITTAGDEAKLGVTANSAKDLYPNICISNVKQKAKAFVGTVTRL